MHDQADELRQLVRHAAHAGPAARSAAPLVVVSGGKGGVGTTTLAANLAVALARQGRRAVFVDADLDHGGHTQLSQNPDCGSVIDVLAGRRSVHEVLQRGPSGVQVLSGAWASGESLEYPPRAQQRFIADLKCLAPHAEAVVVDAGGSRGQFAKALWQSASMVLVVTTTDDTSILQSYAAIKVLSAGEGSAPIHTLVNRPSDADSAADAQRRIADACRRFLALTAVAGQSVAACEGPTTHEPVLIFPPRGEAARAMDRAADTLWAHLQMTAARDSQSRRRWAVRS